MIRSLVLAAIALNLGTVWAKSDPCRIRSRQMALAKNCYTGDMAKTQDGPQFFTSSLGPVQGANYCHNSLIEVERKAGQAQMRIHVLRDGKDGNAHAYQFTLATDDLKKSKGNGMLFGLKGLKADCFSPTGDREVCNGGFLKTIGLKDTALPMVLGLSKSGAITHLAFDPKEIEGNKPKDLDGYVINDTAPIFARMVSDIHRRLAQMANVKMAQVNSRKVTPKKLAETSEQFRYCSMALESFVKAQKLSDPFTAPEKTVMNTLTNFMNNDPNFATVSRLPATSTPVVKGH
jgi:hypothetical protein